MKSGLESDSSQLGTDLVPDMEHATGAFPAATTKIEHAGWHFPSIHGKKGTNDVPRFT